MTREKEVKLSGAEIAFVIFDERSNMDDEIVRKYLNRIKGIKPMFNKYKRIRTLTFIRKYDSKHRKGIKVKTDGYFSNATSKTGLVYQVYMNGKQSQLDSDWFKETQGGKIL